MEDLVNSRIQTIYLLVTEETTFALIIKNAVSVSGYTVLCTEHSKLQVCIRRKTHKKSY